MKMNWLIYAILGAMFAAVVNVLSKKALDKMDFMVALSIQSLLMLLTLLILTTTLGRWPQLSAAPKWGIGLIALSGMAAGASWFFGYRALQMSSVSQATPIDRLSLPMAVILALIFLKEVPTAWNWLGIGLMLVGAYFVASGKK